MTQHTKYITKAQHTIVIRDQFTQDERKLVTLWEQWTAMGELPDLTGEMEAERGEIAREIVRLEWEIGIGKN